MCKYQNICVKKQEIYLFKSYTTVSTKPSKFKSGRTEV